MILKDAEPTLGTEPTCSEQTFSHPDYTKLPYGVELAQRCGYSIEELEQLERFQKLFERAKKILLFSSDHDEGLGDLIVRLTTAQVLALTHPDKQIVLMAPRFNFPASLLRLPENVLIEQTAVSEVIASIGVNQKNWFALVDYPPVSAAQQALRLIFADRFMGDLTPYQWNQRLKRRTNNQFFETPFSQRIYFSQKYIDDTFPEVTRNGRSSCVNFYPLFTGALLGVRIQLEHIQRPILNTAIIDQDNLVTDNPSNRPLRVLILPDAKEFRTFDWEAGADRSKKSLSVSQWREISERLPKDAEYSIVKGHNNQWYTVQVARYFSSSIEVRQVYCPSLIELAHQICSSDVFIGMDSGTTHLADQCAKAVALLGGRLSLLEIMNSELVVPRRYAVIGAEKNPAKVLVCRPEQDINKDLGKIPVEPIASFISRNIEQHRSAT